MPALFRNILVNAALLLSLPAQAQEQSEMKLDGDSAFMDTEACAKGLASEGCILSFSLSGKAAQTLYDGMTEKAEREECTGGLQKFNDSGLACFKYDDGTYTCSFGYHFADHRFGGSHETC
jgi:hypothetical protein